MPKPTTSTKHYQIAQKLRSHLQQYKPGQPLATVRHLADEHDVAQGTVVRALGQLRAEGVIERPAGKMRLVVTERHDRCLQRVTIARPDWPSPDFDAVVTNIVQAGKRRGWGFTIKTYSNLQSLDLNRVTGTSGATVLLPNSGVFPETLRDALRRPSKPVVLVYEPIQDLGVPVVSTDDKRCSRLAVQHLVDLGHRRILAVISEPPSAMILERIAGWREGMRENRLEDGLDDLLVNCGTQPTQQSIDVAYEYFSSWIQNSAVEFTAIYCDCWTGALGITRALRERGVNIPEDVSVIAFSGEGAIAPFLNPPLTAVEVDMTSYGETVVDTLDRALNGDTIPPDTRIQPMLRIRETTAPPADPIQQAHARVIQT